MFGGIETKGTKTSPSHTGWRESFFSTSERSELWIDRWFWIQRAQSVGGWGPAHGFKFSLWQYFHDSLCVGIIDAHVWKQLCTPVWRPEKDVICVLLHHSPSYSLEAGIVNEYGARLEPARSSGSTVYMHCPAPVPQPLRGGVTGTKVTTLVFTQLFTWVVGSKFRLLFLPRTHFSPGSHLSSPLWESWW